MQVECRNAVKWIGTSRAANKIRGSTTARKLPAGCHARVSPVVYLPTVRTVHLTFRHSTRSIDSGKHAASHRRPLSRRIRRNSIIDRREIYFKEYASAPSIWASISNIKDLPPSSGRCPRRMNRRGARCSLHTWIVKSPAAWRFGPLNDGTAEMKRLYVRPNYRKFGCGQLLGRRRHRCRQASRLPHPAPRHPGQHDLGPSALSQTRLRRDRAIQRQISAGHAVLFSGL